MNKVCKKCGETKALSLFPKHKKQADGHLNSCKVCISAYLSAWRAKNPDKVLANYERGKNRNILATMPSDAKQICTVCNTEKLLSHFYPSKLGKFGVRADCRECCVKANRKFREENREFVNQSAREYRKNNPLQARAAWQKFAAANREKRLEQRKVWRLQNLEHEKTREREYLKNNRPIVYAKNARRRAAESNAVPKWLTAIQKAQIKEFYDIALARRIQTGKKHHVDHIIPLRSNVVMGLHVPWNLQVLTEFENCSKHNKVLDKGE